MTRRILFGALAFLVGSTLLPSSSVQAAVSSQEIVYRKLTFPVLGPVSYGDSWGDPRGGGSRQHQGADLMGRKMQVLVAANDGVVSWVRTDGNNMLRITDDDGWSYLYVHLNNDTPGTDDGANRPEHVLFPGVVRGARVTAGQPVAYLGDSGNAEGTAPHLHFELHHPNGTVVNAYWSLMLSQGRRVRDRCAFDETPTRPAPVRTGGYWTLTNDGGVYSYGGAPFHGSMSGRRLNAQIIALEPTPAGSGYWQLASDGGIFSFGDAGFHGSTGAMRLNQPVVGMAATPTGRGYWLVARDGGIFSFGDARFHGSTGAMRLNQPVVGMGATPTGKGYWLVAADGGVFSFGDARYLGSTGGRTATPVVDLEVSPTGTGYWMLTSGGAVLPFGDAVAAGGVDQIGFCTVPKAVRLAPTSTGRGYWVQAADGNTFAFGDAPDLGSVKRSGLTTPPVVGLAAS